MPSAGDDRVTDGLLTDGWRKAALTAFDRALAAGHPAGVTGSAMDLLTVAPTVILAVGKAAASMAQAVRDAGCDAPGIVVTNDESFAEVAGLRCFASSHPVPDSRGLAAAAEVEDLLRGLNEDDHLLLLISGGGSALLPAPSPGITLAQKQLLNEALLASGLDIHAMNVVRRLFSRLKGGRMARLAAPARITQFLLSDVPGDRFESIASGPAVPDPVPLADAVAMIRDNRLDELDFVAAHLDHIAAGEVDLPLRAEDPEAGLVMTHLLASNDLCRGAARDSLLPALPDLTPIDLAELDGDAARCAAELAASVAAAATTDRVVAITGGETTVQLGKAPTGKGGRAQEMVVAFASAMHAMEAAPAHWLALVGGTDGRDGPTDAAGALITSGDPFDGDAAAASLAAHDAYHYLSVRDQLVKVPPTGTNLGDIAIFMAAGS